MLVLVSKMAYQAISINMKRGHISLSISQFRYSGGEEISGLTKSDMYSNAGGFWLAMTAD